MTYNYSDVHTLGVLPVLLPVPYIPDIFSQSVFTVSFRNVGAAAATIILLGRLSNQTRIPVPASNNGIVLDNIPWDTIASGAIGSATAPTDVWITIMEQKQAEVLLPAPIVNERRILAEKTILSDDRDAFVVIY